MIKRRRIMGLVFCAVATPLLAWQTERTEHTPEPVYEIVKGIEPPRPIHQVAPEYPVKGLPVSGAVLIALVVSSKGEPSEVHVTRSLEKDVDQAAVAAVKEWRFDPATKDGKPIAVRISVEIRFHDM